MVSFALGFLGGVSAIGLLAVLLLIAAYSDLDRKEH